MRICRDNTTYSFLSLPPSPPFDLDSDFSRTFHPTLCLCPSGPPLPPAHGIEVALIPTTRASPPLDALHPSADKGFDPAAGALTGDRNSGEGGNMGFVPVDDIDIGLLSCTESLGFESSDEISSLDYGSSNDSFYSSSSSSSSSSPPSSATSSSPSSPFSWCSSSTPTKRWSEERSEKKEFPPPLTTMSENGRRNFVLRSERKGGRLEIVKMAIERPEVLYASRQNGRLTMHLVRSVPQFEEYDDVFEEEDDDEEEEEEEGEEETEKEMEEERETGEEEAEEERETTAANAVEEKEEEEREWNIPTAGVRRCYQYQYHVHVWGQQQRRWVTTM